MKKKDNNVIRVDSMVEGTFRTCDKTQSEVFRKLLNRMGPEDRMLILSISGTQLRVMASPLHFKDGLLSSKMSKAKGVFNVLSSHTYRVLDGSKWTPIQIKNLFEREGIMLVNYGAIVKHFGEPNTGSSTESSDLPLPTPKTKSRSTRAYS